VLIIILGTRQLGSYSASLVAALLYLVNFAVPNFRLAGLVDAGEGFFLLALLWSFSQRELWVLPLIAVLGVLTKESFIPFSVVFMAAWWCVVWKKLDSPARSAIWIVSTWIAGFAVMVGLHWRISGHPISPVEFAEALHGNHQYMNHFISSLEDRNFWYVFFWLLPLGIPNWRNFPRSWLVPTAATALTVFVLDGYYGGAPGTVGRALFSVAGPLLALSAASFLVWGRRSF
jgi:hypothetical protein